jgi:hypothetical protein
MTHSALQIPFQVTDWNIHSSEEHPGETGTSWWKTVQYPGLRIRQVIYSKNYKADHWCRKGHLVFCIAGAFTSEMEDGTEVILREGMSYHVSDELSSHRSHTTEGATLLIIDGDFLKS